MIRIGSRASRLAKWQAQYVKAKLEALGQKAEIVYITTTGDQIQDRPLHEIGGKGVFIKSLEQALLDRSIDVAVHSMKDMPARLAGPFEIPAVLARHKAGDLWIAKSAPPPVVSKAYVASLPAPKVATGSLRRGALIRGANPEATIVPIRGNVDTRLKAFMESDWDALILAEASIERLGLSTLAAPLDPTWYVPSPAQGALALECLRDHPLASTLAALDDPLTRRHTSCERTLLAMLGGDCTMPIGAHALAASVTAPTSFTATVLSRDGREARAQVSGEQTPEILASRLLQGLKDQGLLEIFDLLGLSLPDPEADN